MIKGIGLRVHITEVLPDHFPSLPQGGTRSEEASAEDRRQSANHHSRVGMRAYRFVPAADQDRPWDLAGNPVARSADLRFAPLLWVKTDGDI